MSRPLTSRAAAARPSAASAASAAAVDAICLDAAAGNDQRGVPLMDPRERALLEPAACFQARTLPEWHVYQLEENAKTN